jgi:hypothetical protein
MVGSEILATSESILDGPLAAKWNGFYGRSTSSGDREDVEGGTYEYSSGTNYSFADGDDYEFSS